MGLSGLGWVLSMLVRFTSVRTRSLQRSQSKSPSGLAPHRQIQASAPESNVREAAILPKEVLSTTIPKADHRIYPQTQNTMMADWTKEDVQNWLLQNGNAALVPIFRSNSIDGLTLVSATVEELVSIGINLGRAKRVISEREAM